MRTTSRFRGVTHHCRTQRWEAHIWEAGKQIYLGGFSGEEQVRGRAVQGPGRPTLHVNTGGMAPYPMLGFCLNASQPPLARVQLV